MIRPASIRLAAVITLGFSTDIAAQAAPPDAWRFVPALTTICYPDDGFNEKLNAANTALQTEIDRQKQINAAAKEKFDNMDMGEKAQRMQAFMMKNPQAAMKMMQAEQAAGTAVTSAVTDANESAKRLDAELKRHEASFRTAAEQAVKPIQAKQKVLIDTKTIAVGEAQISVFTTAADHAQYVQLIAQENAAYEQACAPYFGANGAFHKWLNSYRTEVIDKMIATGDAGDGAMVMQMAAMDLPSGGYRPTTSLQQAQNYLVKVRAVYDIRKNKARAVVELRK